MDLFNEVALYGALIHVEAKGVIKYIETIRQTLTESGAKVRSIEAIRPSLEDAFISSVRSEPASPGGALDAN